MVNGDKTCMLSVALIDLDIVWPVSDSKDHRLYRRVGFDPHYLVLMKPRIQLNETSG